MFIKIVYILIVTITGGNNMIKNITKKIAGLILGTAMILGVGVSLGSTHGEAIGVKAATSTEVTYKLGGKVKDITVTTSGTAPTGSSAKYSQTYNNGIGQMTKDNSTTLTLSGYSGYKITGLVLSMKSNNKAGAGTFSLKAGSTTLAEISSGTDFNSWYDNTSFTASYKNINVTLKNSDYSIASGESVVVYMEGTTNSIFVESYKFTYEEATTDPSVTIQDNITSIDVFKGKTNNDVKVKVSNIDSPVWSFTFDEGEDTGKTTSDFISLTQSDLVSDISTLSIVGNEIGTTIIHISVSGTECTSTLTVNVVACPASMSVSHSDITDGKLEIETEKYKQLKDFSGLDTDGNEYAIGVDDVSYSVETEGIITVAKATTFKITGSKVGTTTIKFYLTKLEDVSTTLTVAVLDDFQEEVKSITFNENLTSEATLNPVEGIFKTRTAKTHFGETETIAFEDFTFSYSDDRTTAVPASEFKYDLEHGTLVDGSDVNKLQTIYVFTELDTEKSYSYDITITHKFITGLVVDGKEVESGDLTELSILRNTTKQLDVKVTPTDTTQDQTILYSVDDTTEGKITVDDKGLITVGNVLGETLATVKASSKANPDLYYEFYINATLEEMTITTDVEEKVEKITSTSSLKYGDKIGIVYEDKSKQLSGVSNNKGTATGYDNNPSKDYVFTLTKGNSSGTYAFYNETSKNYLALTSSNNNLYTSSTLGATSSWNISFNGYGDAVITNVSYTGRILKYNTNKSGGNVFCCYTSSSGDVEFPQIYKFTGSETYTVESDLINAIETFMSPTNFECDPNGQTFNDTAWANHSGFTDDLITKYDLANVKANKSGNEVEQFLYNYDIVIWKKINGHGAYANAEDFLGREATIKANSLSKNTVINDNNTAIMTVVIISFVGITAIGGYLFIRKQKQY